MSKEKKTESEKKSAGKIVGILMLVLFLLCIVVCVIIKAGKNRPDGEMAELLASALTDAGYDGIPEKEELMETVERLVAILKQMKGDSREKLIRAVEMQLREKGWNLTDQ